MMTKNEKIKASILKTREKRANQLCCVYRVKIVENKLRQKQLNQLNGMFIEAKWFYNHCLNLSKENKDFSLLKFNPLSIKEVKHFDKDNNEIVSTIDYLPASMRQDIVKQMCSNIKTMNTLKKNGIQKKHGNLKFKSEIKSLPLKQYGVTHKIVGKHRIRIQGIHKPIYVRGLDQIDLENCEIANMKLLNRADGYFLSIVTYQNKTDLKKNDKSILPAIAIDMGCSTAATDSDGNKIECVVEETEHLKRLQQQFARQIKGSNNYYRTKKQIGKIYQRMTNKKDDIANKIVHELTKHELVIMQDEQLQNWHKGGHGKTIQHSCLGRIKSKLKQKENVFVLDRFIPTTKFCTNCGKIHEMKVWNRIFKCDCGIEPIDRDVHAAKTMLWICQNLKIPQGLREFKRVDFLNALNEWIINDKKFISNIQTNGKDESRSRESLDSW